MKVKFNACQDKGQCQVCKKTNHTSIWKVFAQVGWFRGDDIYLGKLCKYCKTKENMESILKMVARN